MFNRYYEQELQHLRHVAAEFAKRNPALAPLLGNQTAADTDVERLLEGVAFLSGMIRQRLDDDFPEIIQSLAQLMFPHFLRPIPCMTIMQYQLRVESGERVAVPKGTTFAGQNDQGQRFVFSSIFDVMVDALQIKEAYWESASHIKEKQFLILKLDYQGKDATAWPGQSLRIWLGGSYGPASNLFRLFMQELEHIWIEDESGNAFQLPPQALKAVGFDESSELLPWSKAAHPSWRMLYEYFAFPQKFLFFDVNPLTAWADRKGNTFSLRFSFKRIPEWAPEVSTANFLLNAVPVVNLYEQSAQPIYVDQRQTEYRVHPSKQRQIQSAIFTVNQVISRNEDGTESVYDSFGHFQTKAPNYHLRLKPSPITNELEMFISLPRQLKTDQQKKTLSVALTCCDGDGPSQLRLGALSEPTDHTPSRIRYENVMAISEYCPPVADNDLLWKVLSHMQANQIGLLGREQLVQLLKLYLPNYKHDTPLSSVAQQQINSIEEITTKPVRKMVRGMWVEGTEITVSCIGTYFASPGSLYLFGTVLNELFAGSMALNTFVSVVVIDTVTGERLQWPMRTGKHQLI